MPFTITLNPKKLVPLRQRDMRLQSYNIEMTELTGGTFWKAYTQGQIEGTEEFTMPKDSGNLVQMMTAMMEPVASINLYDRRIRNLAKALGPAIVRVSGSWSTRTYYDLDDHTGGKVPQGFEFVLTRAQWQGMLDFVKAVGGQLMVSLANCAGVHENGVGPWMPDQAEALWNYTEAQGVTIDYVEFMNEPNMLNGMMLPAGYGAAEFARDHDLFARWLRKNHPQTKLVGPSAAESPRGANAGGFAALLLHTRDLLPLCKEPLDIFSYHSYVGTSERGQLFGQHFSFDDVTSEEYLHYSMEDLHYNQAIRDEFSPGAEMWVTESADASCGGNTWTPTFVETIRYVDELARFAGETAGIIFHNTLASSAYGLLDPLTHRPRPMYWGGLLFNCLAGETVYTTSEPIREGVHLYAFSRKDGKEGVCYIYINNSRTDTAEINVPACERYTLSSDHLRSQKIFLNGQELNLTVEDRLPEWTPVHEPAGVLSLPPCTVSFLVV